MSSADDALEDLIKEFVDFTACSTDRARFYLDSSGWDLSVALDSFFANPTDDDLIDEPSPPPPPPRQPNQSLPPTQSPNQPPASNMARNMRTLRDLQAQQSDSDDDEGQRFFAGGSEHSGQQIVGPPGKKPDANFVRNFLVQASQAANADQSSSGQRSAFTLPGVRSGVRDDPSGNSTQEPPNPTIQVFMWRTGFSINDGPLREYELPESQKFLEYLKKGEMPRELVAMTKTGEISVEIRDNHGQDYVPPKKEPFTGAGHRLGNIEPPCTAVGVPPTDPAACEQNASKAVAFDAEKPSTNLKIRLADGTTLDAKMNLTNTVGDVRRYILTARPQYETSTFILLTTFPRQEFSDDSVTISDAKLQGAVIVQKLT